MLIDPTKITNYDLTIPELEKTLFWWVLAAGKNGVRAAAALELLLDKVGQKFGNSLSPFQLIKQYSNSAELAVDMKSCGIGCHNNKSKTFVQLAASGLDLKTCSVSDLEKIYGIGCKTSRCMIIHSRPGQRLAGLDVHILHFLKDCGYDVPKSTPASPKQYLKIEQWFLAEADRAGSDVATFDLMLWNKYRKK